MAYYKTKKPTGLSVARKAKVLTLSWKKDEPDYKYGQQMATQLRSTKHITKVVYKYMKVKGKWKRTHKAGVAKTYTEKKDVVGKQNIVNVNVENTSSTLKIDTSKYFPNTQEFLNSVTFWARGKRATTKWNDITYYPDWSDWSSVVFTLEKPSKPKVTAEWNSTNENQTKFSWESPDKDTDKKWFTDYEWQWLLIENCNVKSGSKVKGWSEAPTSHGSGKTKTITEDTPFTGYYSYTRWVRVRCRGPKGLSKWVYKNHVYAMPPIPTDVNSAAKLLSDNQGYNISVKWIASESIAHPIDNSIVEYTVDTPATLTRSVIVKDKVSWSHTELMPFSFSSGTQIAAPKDTKGSDGIAFALTPMTPNDKSVIIRVKTKHDNKEGPSTPVYVKKAFGKLTNPVLTSVGTPDPQTNRIAVSVTNGSAVDNTFVAIYCKLASKPADFKCIGIIPKGTTSGTFVMPDVSQEDNYSIGAKTWLADFSPVTPAQTGVTNYSIDNMLMESDIIWDDRPVPKAPKNVTLSVPPDKQGAIRVSWDWTWTEANNAELSWSEDPDAWESTNQPSTYTVNNTNDGSWLISGLSVGTWHVRVRLFKSDNDQETVYGAYSDRASISIASAPMTPALMVNPDVVTSTGELECTWVYTTSDGTAQSYAAITEAYPKYAVVSNPSGNPSEKLYYERGRQFDGTHYVYSLSGDTTVVSGKTYYEALGTWDYKADAIANTYTAERLAIFVEQQDWQSGETHYLALRVTAASGESSKEWSTPVPVAIAEAPTVSITATSLVDRHVLVDPDESVYDDYKALIKMPLSLTVIGAGLTGETTVAIRRAQPYDINRPDGSQTDGYEGETVALITQSGEAPIEINQSDLMGYFDDGCRYSIIATVTDSYGQSVSTDDEEEPLEFKVEWAHQAVMPSAEVEIFESDLYATIKPIAPTGLYEASIDTSVTSGKTYYSRSGSGTDEDPYVYTPIANPSGNPSTSGYYEAYDSSKDHCDIYRLSCDPPTLIYGNAKFGTKYVDPYPTLGSFGGYRIVYITENGDYITADNRLAWTEYNDPAQHQFKTFATIIDFGTDKAILPYDISVSNKWSKDFTETKYLGGSVQGDWNPAVSRTATVKSTTVVGEDPDTIQAMRRLAVYAGVCHIRTPEGSSYSANVNVSEDREEKWVTRLAKFSLDITRVDSEDDDEAVEYDKWISQ